MTYPQQYGPPPVAHIDPQYAQQYAAQYPMPPQGYPSPIPAQPVQPPLYQQADQPPNLGGQMPPTAAPRLGESTRTGGGTAFPKERHYVGRTIIIEPVSIDEDRTQKNDKTGELEKRPMATFHLTIVDGGPLQYGDNQSRDPKESHGYTMVTETPARFTNVTSDRFGIVNEVRDTMARGDMASVGVLVQGTRGGFPFLMTKCAMDLDRNPRPDGNERFERATAVWNAIFAKTFQSPEPRSLVAPPAQQPPQVAYQPQTQATYVPPAQQPVPPYQPTQYGTPGTYVPPQPQPGYGQFGEQPPQGYYAAPQSAPPTPPSAQQGYGQNPAFEAWLATLPPEQQAAQRAAMAGQPAAGPGI